MFQWEPKNVWLKTQKVEDDPEHVAADALYVKVETRILPPRRWIGNWADVSEGNGDSQQRMEKGKHGGVFMANTERFEFTHGALWRRTTHAHVPLHTKRKHTHAQIHTFMFSFHLTTEKHHVRNKKTVSQFSSNARTHFHTHHTRAYNTHTHARSDQKLDTRSLAPPKTQTILLYIFWNIPEWFESLRFSCESSHIFFRSFAGSLGEILSQTLR